MDPLAAIDRALATHATTRTNLAQQRRYAGYLTPADEDVAEVRAELDRRIQHETAEIDRLLATRSGVRSMLIPT